MTTSPPSPGTAATLRRGLLAWYDCHRRALPWRAPPGEVPVPYRVWLSEIMLQQTTVATAIPYFNAFIRRWPTVAALAAAPLDDVLHAWQGLGYYARARRLHAAAGIVSDRLGGRFPEDEAGLASLPGIGSYTAAAIAAIAFGRRAAPVDGNVARVLARLFAVTEPVKRVRPRLEVLARALTPASRPGDFAQAVMDLGATVCRPRAPDCPSCPWQRFCAARRLGRPEALPVVAAVRARPVRHGVAFWVRRADGQALLRRRPDDGLLGGLVEVPTTPWRERPWTLSEARAHAPMPARWHLVPGVVRHGFTHFRLELVIAVGRRTRGALPRGLWCPPERLGEHALPTLMRKVIGHALAAGTGAANVGPSGRRRPGRRTAHPDASARPRK